MVRVNIIEPSALADQHLIAEYREILMLFGAVRKYPKMDSVGAHFMKNPVRYFSDRLEYLVKRHAKIRDEMKKRGFRCSLSPRISGYAKTRMDGFSGTRTQLREIKARLIERLRAPPREGFYKYYGKDVPAEYLVSLIKRARGLKV